MKVFKILLIGSAWILASCQTASLVTKVDVKRKNIEIQSQSDVGSAVLALQKEGALESLKRDLEDKVKKNRKDVPSLINLSQIALAQANYKKADEYCRQALKFDLDNRDAKLILAQIYYRRGYHDMSDIILNSLGSEADKDPIALNLKGLIELANDRPSHAMHLFKTALKYSPGDVATRMNLGVLYVYYRQIEQAAVEFERVLKVMPNHIDAKMHLAVIKASRGQFEQAENLYKDVMDADSKNALATYNMAVLEEKRKNFDDSLDYLKTYLNSTYAQGQSNKETFAMIERLKAKKEMRGDKVSDSEIKELAEQIQQNQEVAANRKLQESRSSSETTAASPVKKKRVRKAVQPPPVAREEPVKVKKVEKAKPKKNYDPSNDSIESLEQELFE